MITQTQPIILKVFENGRFKGYEFEHMGKWFHKLMENEMIVSEGFIPMGANKVIKRVHYIGLEDCNNRMLFEGDTLINLNTTESFYIKFEDGGYVYQSFEDRECYTPFASHHDLENTLSRLMYIGDIFSMTGEIVPEFIPAKISFNQITESK